MSADTEAEGGMNNSSTAGAVSAGKGSGNVSATPDARLREFRRQLSDFLVRAGRSHASCVAPSNGPVISFAEWAERAIRKHPEVFTFAYADMKEALEQIAGYKPIRQPPMWTKTPADIARAALAKAKHPVEEPADRDHIAAPQLKDSP